MCVIRCAADEVALGTIEMAVPVAERLPLFARHLSTIPGDTVAPDRDSRAASSISSVAAVTAAGGGRTTARDAGKERSSNRGSALDGGFGRALI
jgi:hypothetical protein